MKQLQALFVVCTLVGAGAGCGQTSHRSPAAPSPPAIGPSALAYLNEILDLMQRSSVNRNSIDWTLFRATVVAEAGSAQEIGQLHSAIQLAIRLLGDGHSFYRSSNNVVVSGIARNCRGTATTPAQPTAGIGVIAVTNFSGSVEAAISFAAGLQSAIAAQDRGELAGWIVDLRGNSGGNMWPMIAGVGPVLGAGPLGYFVLPNGVQTAWDYRDGVALLANNPQIRVPSPYRLRQPGPRVAVLTDMRTASSGEAALIAFRGRPNTRTFGQATCGLSTVNSTLTLSDGAQLNLTTGVMADRTGRRYGDTLTPDEVIEDQALTVQRAIEWIGTGR